jgi:hypothetical protein
MRRRTDDTEVFGSDSFLDVVCNVVGMLIILVVIVGIRAGQAGKVTTPDTAAAEQALSALQGEHSAAEAEVLRLANEMRSVAMQAQALSRERDAVAVLVAAGERMLEEQRKALDAHAQDDYGRRRAVADATQQLALLEQQLAAPLDRAPTVKLTSYQTPMSKSVNGKELQFQLRGGRVTMIPIEELLDRFKSDAQAKAYRLRNQPELTETIGPIGGFRMRYVLERIDASVEEQMRAGRSMSVVQLAEYTLIPDSMALGETLDEALASRSQFHADLTPYKPAETTVTLWTYEDSFKEYRALKEDLHRLGYAVAGRPMPHGQPIGGSPQGSRSAAQ